MRVCARRRRTGQPPVAPEMVQYAVEGTHVHENEESVVARNQLTRFALRSTHLQLSWGVIVADGQISIRAATRAFVVNRFKCGGESPG